MVRLFNVYYPVRTLVLLAGEVLLIGLSFVAATLIQFGPDASLVLNYEYGFYKIIGVTAFAVLCLYYFDLYDLQRVRSREETFFRLLAVLGTISFLLAAFGTRFPELMIGNNVFLVGLFILTLALVSWRALYAWLISHPALREGAYVLGAGERARRVVDILRTRKELGMDVVGWAGAMGNGSLTREELGRTLVGLRDARSAQRVIVALSDRRGTMPARELLDLRLSGIKVEDATALLEKVTGQIDIEELHPSWLIYSEGFRLHETYLFLRRMIAILFSLLGLLVVLPVIPLIILAIKATSPGPVLYRQKRVGRNGQIFDCYKFRTMRADAEADTGPTWASDDDPRITPVGRLLRRTRLDEIPQLWNVLRGDMGLVGPRPERPEFVNWLSQELPYYHLRHLIRPGITGWAQINYPYGGSLEESKEKLKYDLYYIKNLSLVLDLYIIFSTVKIVVFGRGAK